MNDIFDYDYFEFSRWVSDRVNPYLCLAIDWLESENEDIDFDFVKYLIKNRIQTKVKVRANLFFAIVLAGNEDHCVAWDVDQWARIGAACELELCRMYYVNRVYDSKGGERSKSKDYSEIMAGLICRGLAMRMLDGVILKPMKKLSLLRTFNQLDIDFEVGERLDVFINVYLSGLANSWEQAFVRYEKRTYLINAMFFEYIAELASCFIDSTKVNVHLLKQFGFCYGMIIQEINDLADFVPVKHELQTSEKIAADAYSDVLKGKLTLPIIYILFKGSEVERRFLQKILQQRKADKEQLASLTKMVVNGGGYDYCRGLIIKRQKKAKQIVRRLPMPKRKFMSQMLMIATTNKYFKVLDLYRK